MTFSLHAFALSGLFRRWIS